ncbi:IpaD/SipD/SspD family type III secretion system needle tip protein [Salmonella enterica subsp. enterica serovar Kinondoni]|nr:IpaD/SipD/SspD family type III secretion system needle tip protein [Salmonella enterica subsp. enterica serovar Kinondoni]
MRFTPSYIKDAFAAFSKKYSASLTINDKVLAQKNCDTMGDVKKFEKEYNLQEIKNQLRQQYQNFEPAFKVYVKAYFDEEYVDDLDFVFKYYDIKLITTSHVNFNFPKWPLDNLPDDNCTISSYQAWLASFNAFGNQLQSNMQSFAQTYSQVNSTFNNLNKVLSSTITALGESANFVLKSLS